MIRWRLKQFRTILNWCLNRFLMWSCHEIIVTLLKDWVSTFYSSNDFPFSFPWIGSLLNWGLYLLFLDEIWRRLVKGLLFLRICISLVLKLLLKIQAVTSFSSCIIYINVSNLALMMRYNAAHIENKSWWRGHRWVMESHRIFILLYPLALHALLVF